AAQVTRGIVFIGPFMDIVNSPIQPVQVQMIKFSVKRRVSHRQQQIARELITHALCPITLVCRVVSSNVIPPIVDPTVQDQGIEFFNGRIREQWKIQFPRSINALEIYSKRMLRVLPGLSLGSALNLQSAVNLGSF